MTTFNPTAPQSPANASTTPPAPVDDGTGIVAYDPWLGPYAPRLRDRHAYYKSVRGEIDAHGGLLGPISQGHHYYGLNRGERDGKTGVWYREWAPGAKSLALIGDFNGWDRGATPLNRDEFGVWSVFLDDARYAGRLVHGSQLMVHVVGETGGGMDRIPAYVRRVVQDPTTHGFTGQFWSPREQYQFRNPATPPLDGALRVYETHVGMATEEAKVGSFDDFTRVVLPRIKHLGYNAIQLMAVMEHPYYGSFGYHVSNFFAVSSRFGTPEELKHLIDVAHSMGIRVLLDIVHSHSVKNTREGLNGFDGTDHQYFHAGPKGQHSGWDSLLFDYGKYEVRRFLLSNVRFWLEEFRFDGFRFDGVTSMMYLDHGLGSGWNSYDDYFGLNVDYDAVVYLQLANELTHQVNASAITVAEDVSGMVGLARPVAEGGLGFDYRLAMGIPDYWIKLLKHQRDEDWNLGQLFGVMMNRRRGENHIGYAESHDQALVGDKTIAFWLMDKEMYWSMNKGSQNLVIDRGIALHKMIRLITFSLAGEGWLNFHGNEFGHPEWVDFPREGNGYSYHYARRQWGLADHPDLRYHGLQEFDRAMQDVDRRFNLLNDPFIELLYVHEADRQICYRRGPLVFVFNFHPTQSFTDLRVPVPDATDYKLILDSDAKEFEGFGRVQAGIVYPKQDVDAWGRQQSVQIYLPNRSVQVLAPV